MATHSILQLEQCYIRGLSIETDAAAVDHLFEKTQQESASNEIPYKLKLDERLRSAPSGSKFWLTLSIELKWPDDAFNYYKRIFVELDGVFRLPDETSEDDVAKYVPLLVRTNLLGIARGVVAQATGMFPGGPYCIPFLNMKQVDASIESETAGIEAKTETS